MTRIKLPHSELQRWNYHIRRVKSERLHLRVKHLKHPVPHFEERELALTRKIGRLKEGRERWLRKSLGALYIPSYTYTRKMYMDVGTCPICVKSRISGRVLTREEMVHVQRHRVR